MKHEYSKEQEDNLIEAADYMGNVCKRPMRRNGEFHRCDSQDYSVCPSCAKRHQFFDKAILTSGIVEDYTADPKEYTLKKGFYFVFVTFTAPSFGKIKTQGVPEYFYDKKKKHNPGDLVFWNFNASKLLKAAVNNARRKSGFETRDFAYAGVWEYQKRLALHAHCIFRFSDSVPKEKAIEFIDTVSKYTLDIPRDESTYKMKFGRQKDVEFMSEKYTEAENSIRYMVKVVSYTVKSLTQTKDGVVETAEMARYLNGLNRSADKLVCNRKNCAGDGNCKGTAHRRIGFGGYKLAKSDNWSSLTKSKLKEDGREYAEMKALEDPEGYQKILDQYERKAEAAMIKTKQYMESEFGNVDLTLEDVEHEADEILAWFLEDEEIPQS